MPSWRPAGIKKRSDFVRVQSLGVKQRTATFILLTLPRPDLGTAQGGLMESASARLGLVVSRRVGNAVCRNRVRRRLRAIARHCEETLWLTEIDYVLIATPSSAEARYQTMRDEVVSLLERVKRRVRAPLRPHSPRESASV